MRIWLGKCGEGIYMEDVNKMKNIFSSITVDYRTLFSELCTEQILMLVRPVEVKLRKKQRKINTEVADLKVKLSQCNKNIVLSNREIRLLR